MVSSTVPSLHPMIDSSSESVTGFIVKTNTPLSVSFTKEYVVGFDAFAIHAEKTHIRTCAELTFHIWVSVYGWFVQMIFADSPFSTVPKEVILTHAEIKNNN